MQVDPMNPKLKPPGTKRLKLKCDILLSTSGFKLNLRRYKEVDVAVAASASVVGGSVGGAGGAGAGAAGVGGAGATGAGAGQRDVEDMRAKYGKILASLELEKTELTGERDRLLAGAARAVHLLSALLQLQRSNTNTIEFENNRP